MIGSTGEKKEILREFDDFQKRHLSNRYAKNTGVEKPSKTDPNSSDPLYYPMIILAVILGCLAVGTFLIWLFT